MITISAGNHAQAVAYAAAEDGVDALVVMWPGASRARRSRRRAATARPSTSRRRTRPTRSSASRVLIEQTGRALVHPHEDPLVLAGAGHASALEIEEDAPDADAVIVAVGGGGLIAGIAAALGDRDAHRSPSSPRRAQAFHAAIEAGHPVAGRAELDRRRPQRAVRSASSPFEIVPRPRARARQRGARSRTRSASSTSGRSSRASRPAPRRPRRSSPARSRPSGRSSSSAAATSPPKPPLVSWARR